MNQFKYTRILEINERARNRNTRVSVNRNARVFVNRNARVSVYTCIYNSCTRVLKTRIINTLIRVTRVRVHVYLSTREKPRPLLIKNIQFIFWKTRSFLQSYTNTFITHFNLFLYKNHFHHFNCSNLSNSYSMCSSHYKI